MDELEKPIDQQPNQTPDENSAGETNVPKNDPRSHKPSGNQNRNQPRSGQSNRQSRNKFRSKNRKRSPEQQKQAEAADTGKKTNGSRNGQNQPQGKEDRGQTDRNGTVNGPWGMNPRRTESGIQTRSQRGEFAKNWWARRWLEALERLMQGVRLTRGQHYARLGQVVSMEEIKGGVVARVQGSRQKPYRVTIQLAPFNNKQWEKVFDLLADKAIYVAQLLAGDMPEDIEEVLMKPG